MTMGKCFVMQPFDGGVFDDRYADVFSVGIKDAGLEPYRVDRDPGVSVPIDEIESGIRNAQLCFAEITTDNPNVWFELGFSIAASRDVVLVCSDERKSQFPFDVQHRSVIKYRTGSTRDFEELKKKITERISALVKKGKEIGHVSSVSPIKSTDGLSQHEIVALVTIMQNEFVLGGAVSPHSVVSDMNHAGFTDIAVSLAVKRLESKAMVRMENCQDDRGDYYDGFLVSKAGEDWLMQNQDLLVLKKEPQTYQRSGDNIPF